MEMIDRLRERLTDNGVVPSDAILTDCIESAKHAILSRRFPYGEYPDDVEPRYKDLQYRIAIDLYNKQGAEGQTSMSENGISRGYESSWISAQLLSEITPYCKTIE